MSNRITKRNLGGVSLTSQKKDIPKQEIIDYFLQNSDFRILTDTSVSCVNYVATLRPDKESPFFSVRSGSFREPVRRILLKVCIHSSKPEFIRDFRENGGIKAMETMTVENIMKEAKIQYDIFKKSYNENVAEPICPAVLYVQHDLYHDNNLQDKYYNYVIENLIERNPTLYPNKDNSITNELFCFHPLSIIFMELAEGYITLSDLWTHVFDKGPDQLMIFQNYLFTTMYELYGLYHTYGIVHGDIHFGNVLINPSFPDDTIGKVLLIDFGKSFYDMAIDKNKGEYDTVIYHQNTESFEIILRVMQHIDKNVYFRKIYEDLDNSKKQKRAYFLSTFFEGSLEKWKHWSENNIHFPFDTSLLGGSYHNTIHKSILVKQSKVKSHHNKMNVIENNNNLPSYDSDRYIILDKKRDDFLPKMKYEFTMEDWIHAAERFSEGLKKTCENLPKVKPASPRKIAEAKRIISDALNAPLEIDHFQNPYMYPIGNPKKVAPIISLPLDSKHTAASKEKQEKTEKKRRTRAKRNTF